MSNNNTERAEAIEILRGFIKPGDSICCTVMHVSKSGMSRTIMLQVAVIGDDGRPYIRDISYTAAKAIGVRFDQNNGGLVMGGCGMNMCFAAVYNLGRVLFPDGFPIEGRTIGGKPCRAKDRAQAARMVKAGATFRGRNGDASGWDTDGGYALDYRG